MGYLSVCSVREICYSKGGKIASLIGRNRPFLQLFLWVLELGLRRGVRSRDCGQTAVLAGGPCGPFYVSTSVMTLFMKAK